MAASPAVSARVSAPDLVRTMRWLRWVVPIAAFAAYALVIALHGAQLSGSAFMYSDAPESAYLGAGVLARQDVTLPLHTEILPTALAGLLLSLPGSHALVQLLGPAMGIALAAVVALTVRRLGGAWLLSAIPLLAPGPIVLFAVLFPTAHVFAMIGAATLALGLVGLIARPLTLTRAVLFSVVAGVALLGDQGFVAYGLLPFLAAAFAGSRWKQDRRVFRDAAAIALGTVAVAGIGQLVIHVLGVHILLAANASLGGFDIQRIAVAINLGLHSFAWLVTGGWYNADSGPFLGALSLIAGGAVPLVAPAAFAMRWRWRSGGGEDAGAIAYCFFWAVADVLVLGAYLTLGFSRSPQSAAYLVPCLVSAFATLPMLGTGPWLAMASRAAVTALACCAAAGLAGLPQLTYAGPLAPADGTQVLSVLSANHLTRGYADYWASHPLTWLSNETVRVFPVDEHCSVDQSAVCRYPFSDGEWYGDTGGASFLIVRRSYPCVNSEPRALLGLPERVIGVDADTTILVYTYDIASRFSPANTQGCFP